jgi:peptidoglycan/LPS O-acetylase OafA/YrhL
VTFKPLLRLPDYSYGIYIWHYPAMQIVMYLRPDFGPWRLMLFSVPLFLVLSALSWHVIEKPALRLKPRPKLDPRARPAGEPEGTIAMDKNSGTENQI